MVSGEFQKWKLGPVGSEMRSVAGRSAAALNHELIKGAASAPNRAIAIYRLKGSPSQTGSAAMPLSIGCDLSGT